MDWFVLGQRRLFGAVLRVASRIIGGLERRAITDGTVVRVGAVGDGRFERRWIPTIQEVAVEPVAGGISLREGEFAAVLLDVVDAVQHLVEKVQQRHLVSRRADAVVEVREVLYVAVVGLVQVDAVPAGLEMDLCSQAVAAAGSGHARLLFARRGVQTRKADSVGFGTVAPWDQGLSVV